MYSNTVETAEQVRLCAAQRHYFNEAIKWDKNRHRYTCRGCANEYGYLYDYEWTKGEIASLVVDYNLAKQCRCDGPQCGESASKRYSELYPMFASLFV